MSDEQATDREAPIIAAMEARFDEIVEDMIARSRSVAGYAVYDDREFLAAARAHVSDHLRAFLTVAKERRLLEPAELEFVRAQAVMRARQGVPMDVMLHVYRSGHEAMFRAIEAAGGDSPGGMAGALALTGRTLPHVDVITTAFTQSYLETLQEEEIEADLARRELIETSLRGSVQPAEAAERARQLGIDPDTPFVVAVCASHAPGVTGFEQLRRLAKRLRGSPSRSPGAAMAAVVREREVVALIPAETTAAVVEGQLAEAIAALGSDIAAGVGLPCDGLAELQRGYGEASAMARRAEAGTVRSLGEHSTADYLALTSDETARRLIDERIREALMRDQRAGGPLLATATAFADADLNATAAAEVLHLHPNSVRYRLDKLSGETDRDLHRLNDLVELLTAASVLGLRSY